VEAAAHVYPATPANYAPSARRWPDSHSICVYADVQAQATRPLVHPLPDVARLNVAPDLAPVAGCAPAALVAAMSDERKQRLGPFGMRIVSDPVALDLTTNEIVDHLGPPPPNRMTVLDGGA
jgi:hypothetical protein